MTTPILAARAAERLATYLDRHEITEPVDRYAALRRSLAVAWLSTLVRHGLADGLDVWDVIAGLDLLAAKEIMRFPTGSGKSHIEQINLLSDVPPLGRRMLAIAAESEVQP